MTIVCLRSRFDVGLEIQRLECAHLTKDNKSLFIIFIVHTSDILYENLKNSGDFVLTWRLDEFVFASLAFEKSWNPIEYRI